MDAEQDERISKIFYYFAEHTNVATGRTVGRKIGVVQEIIVRKLLLQSERLNDAIIFEPFLKGISGASHKVEFVFFQPLLAVEFKINDSYKFGELTLQLIEVSANRAKFLLSGNDTKRKITFPVHYILNSHNSTELLGLAGEGVGLKLAFVNTAEQKARISVLEIQTVRASVESKRVGAQRFANSDTLGAGIQSIEKAKQAALVAVDADLLFNKTLKALLDIKEAEEAKEKEGIEEPKAPRIREYISIVVLGNGIHWTEKDKNILRTYVDYTFQVHDPTIIRYAEFVRNLATEAGELFFPYFMDYFKGMTKTPPDAFEVGEEDFLILCPDNEERSLMQILDGQLRPYDIVKL